MERYEEYKDSGIGWIGGMPSHWECARISSLYDPRNEKASADEYPPLSVTIQGIVPQLETAAKSQDIENRKLVRNGDFVINSRSDRRGSCGIAHQDGTVSLISNVLTPKDPTSLAPDYYEMLFKTEGFADEYYRWGTGIVDDLWSTNWLKMKNITLPAPPREEQGAIAKFLNEKVTEIDRLIDQVEKSIELLGEFRKSVTSEVVTKGLNPDAPMKDSGIEWIGKIPEHWSADSLSRATSLITNGYVGPTRDLFQEDGVRYIQSLHVVEGSIDFQKHPYYVSPEWSNRHSRSILEADDVLIVQTGAIGNVAYVDPSHSGCNCHALIILRSSETLLGRFLFHCLNSSRGRDALLTTKTGATHPHLNSTKICHINIPLPPVEEQLLIVEKLDELLTVTNPAIQKKEQLVAKLSEYRKSLIAEAVTGKFKVPGVE